MVLRLPDSWSNWNLEMLVFEERGKPEYPEKNLLEQGREPTTNSSHIWHRRRDLNPGYIGGRRVLSPLCHPCSPLFLDKTESQRAEKFFLGTAPPILISGSGRPPAPPSQGLDPALQYPLQSASHVCICFSGLINTGLLIQFQVAAYMIQVGGESNS